MKELEKVLWSISYAGFGIALLAFLTLVGSHLLGLGRVFPIWMFHIGFWPMFVALGVLMVLHHMGLREK